LKPAEKIVRLNEMIKTLALQNGFTYCDYYSSLVDDRKGLKGSYSEDGVHPNLEGYKVMKRIVERAIEEALKRFSNKS
jgi:lysophospholipase L1-like esterase